MSATATRSPRRAHREAAAIYLVAGLAAWVVASGLAWKVDVLVSVSVGTLVGTAILAVSAARGHAWTVPAERTVFVTTVSVIAGAGACLAAAAVLDGDGWGILATVLLMFGLGHLWAAR